MKLFQLPDDGGFIIVRNVLMADHDAGAMTGQLAHRAITPSYDVCWSGEGWVKKSADAMKFQNLQDCRNYIRKYQAEHRK